MLFVDLEKTFNRVKREVVRWSLRKVSLDERLIRTVMSLHGKYILIAQSVSALDFNLERAVGVRSSLRVKRECINSGYKLTGLTWWL